MVTLLWHSKWQYLDRYCMDMACFTHIVWLSTMMYTTQSMNISITQRNGKTDWKEFCQAGKIYQVLSNFDRILYWMKKWCYFYWHRFPLPEGPSPPPPLYYICKKFAFFDSSDSMTWCVDAIMQFIAATMVNAKNC